MYLLLSKESVSWGEGSTDSGLPYPTLFSYPFLPSNCTTWGNLLSFSEYLFLFKICIIWRITFITEVLQESRQIMLLKHNPWYIRERVPYDSRDSQESSPAPQFKSISSLTFSFLYGPTVTSWVSWVAQMVKHLPAIWETWVRSLGWEDSLEKGKATHFSILAWEIPWTEEPGRLQSMGSQRVGHD